MYAMSNAIAMIVAIPASILAALVLVGIGLLITSKPSPQLIRKHTGPDTYWSTTPEQLGRIEGVLTAEHRPRHNRIIDDVYDIIDTEETVILNGTLETWESVGRRAADSPVRHAPVPATWMPPIGEMRIAALSTATAEYLFVRKPKDQLQPRLVRSYMTSDLVG